MVPIFVAMDEICRNLGIALGVAHHDRRDGSGPAGGGGLLSTPANVIQLVPDRDTSITTVRCDSMRNCPPFPSFTVTVDAGGVLTLVQAPMRQERPKTHDEVVLEAVAKAKRPLSIDELSTETGLTRRQLDLVVPALVMRKLLVPGAKGASTGGRAPQTYGLPARPQDVDSAILAQCN